ncbi:phage GP46 family protein [Sphingomonas sp. UYP23]
MADIATIWSPSLGIGDWYLQLAEDGTITDDNGLPLIDGAGLSLHDGLFSGVNDLEAGDDLFTAVLISLFTDAQADIDDVISDGSNDPRGWWGDLGEDVRIGSKIWLLSRSKQTEEVRVKAETYLAAALQWLVDDQVAASISVTATWERPSFLGAVINITRNSGTVQAVRADWAWKDAR